MCFIGPDVVLMYTIVYLQGMFWLLLLYIHGVSYWMSSYIWSQNDIALFSCSILLEFGIMGISLLCIHGWHWYLYEKYYSTLELLILVSIH